MTWVQRFGMMPISTQSVYGANTVEGMLRKAGLGVLSPFEQRLVMGRRGPVPLFSQQQQKAFTQLPQYAVAGEKALEAAAGPAWHKYAALGAGAVLALAVVKFVMGRRG